jgi:hypothetical protein
MKSLPWIQCVRSRDIATVYGLDGLGSIPGSGKNLFFSPQPPYRP